MAESAAPEAVRLIGEAFDTYLIAQCGQRLLLIDKHAAHERILFDRLMKEAETHGVNAQLLLSPISVALSPAEYDAVLRHLPLLEKAGYDVSDFGSGTVLLRSCPSALTGADASDLLTQIAGELSGGNPRPEPEQLAWLLHSSACRAAVKAGDRLSDAEMLYLVRRLTEDNDVRYCPHGRPVMIEMTRSQIEKQFGRIAM